jgi:two-component system sensor histidine kinase PilS (NtrC family)
VQARLQVLTDVVLTAILLYATGGLESSFTFLYPLIIITAAILLPRYWAYLTAALAFILFGAILELPYFKVIRSYSSSLPDLRSLQATVLISFFGYLTIAALASYLTSKLRTAAVELQQKSGALQELQALHQNIVQSMSGGLITTDLEGRVQLINPAGQRLLGRPPQDIMGTPMSSLFGGQLPSLGDVRRELSYISPDGTEKIFGMTVCELAGFDREIAGQVYTFTDLTQIRSLEREVRVRDRMAAVGRLASGIAHEIRNPLSAIAGSAQMLRECLGLGEDERTLLDIVRRESDRLNGIVTDFLAYSRVKDYHFETVDLLPLVDEILRLVENKPECSDGAISVVRKFGVTEALAEVDGDRIRQVLWNICDNAIRAMPEGGVLTVAVRFVEGEIEIDFADTGNGIRAQYLENIFEPFHSHFASGTGLGLAIVYQIVQAHEGKVTVESTEGAGTRFSLYLKPSRKQAVAVRSQSYTGSRQLPILQEAVEPVATAGYLRVSGSGGVNRG